MIAVVVTAATRTAMSVLPIVVVEPAVAYLRPAVLAVIAVAVCGAACSAIATIATASSLIAIAGLLRRPRSAAVPVVVLSERIAAQRRHQRNPKRQNQHQNCYFCFHDSSPWLSISQVIVIATTHPLCILRDLMQPKPAGETE
jgi:hypothetical protein